MNETNREQRAPFSRHLPLGWQSAPSSAQYINYQVVSGRQKDWWGRRHRENNSDWAGGRGRASFWGGAKVVAAWISYLKGTTENSIFPLHSCIIFTFSDLFHSPAIKLFHVKLVKTGLDGKRAEFLFSLLNTQKYKKTQKLFWME